MDAFPQCSKLKNKVFWYERKQKTDENNLNKIELIKLEEKKFKWEKNKQ